MTEPTATATTPPPPQPQQQYAPPTTVGSSVTDPRRKSPWLALFLSAMPGLGQVYVGYYQRGFVHILVVASIISLLVAEPAGALIPLFSLFLAFFWLYNIVDAGRRAALYNQALAGGGDIELPEDFKAPGLRGTIAGGAALAIAGFVLLLNTRFGVSLAWLEEWWPMALILFGGYLVWKAIQERAEPE